MSEIIGDREFVEHIRDAIEARVCSYYEEREFKYEMKLMFIILYI